MSNNDIPDSVRDEMKELIANLRNRNNLFLQLFAIYIGSFGIIIYISINRFEYGLILITILSWFMFWIFVTIRKNLKVDISVLFYYQKEILRNHLIECPIRYLVGKKIYEKLKIKDIINRGIAGFNLIFGLTLFLTGLSVIYFIYQFYNIQFGINIWILISIFLSLIVINIICVFIYKGEIKEIEIKQIIETKLENLKYKNENIKK